MKNFLRIVLKVIRAYTLEEIVASVLLLAVFAFFVVKSVAVLMGPTAVFADNSVYTEAEISTRPVLINPLYVDFAQANRDVSSLVFSGLLKYDPKLKNFVDDLASLKISEDKKEYVLTLKNNLKWQDGKDLTVDDVLFTYGIIQHVDFQNPLLKANFEGVKIEKVDLQSIKFVLNRANSFFITNLNVGILPKHLLGNVEIASMLSNQFNVNPIGSGPYKMVKAMESTDDGKQKIVLEKFNDYYGAKPKINQVRFNIYPDESTLLVDKASINIVSRVTAGLMPMVFDNRFKTISYSLPQYTAVFFNTENKVLKDTKVRIGLIKSIDKDTLIAKLDNRIRVDTPLMGLDQKDWIYKPSQSDANGALFDAGYKYVKDDKGQIIPGEKFRKDKDGKILELTMVARSYEQDSSQDTEVRETGQFLINSWEQVGVKLNIQLYNEADFMNAIQEKKYDLILTGQSMGYNLDTFPFWHSSQIKPEGVNLSNFRNFAADAQIEKIRETFDLAEKESRQKKLAEVLSTEVPALFLYRPNYLLLSDGKVQNITLSDLSFPADRFADIADWCVNKDCK